MLRRVNQAGDNASNNEHCWPLAAVSSHRMLWSTSTPQSGSCWELRGPAFCISVSASQSLAEVCSVGSLVWGKGLAFCLLEDKSPEKGADSIY